ncbi:hypothetical protein EV672_107143 [Aquabacterium commune]|uniref:Type IV pilus biogenesis protein PilP n=1 Tax=Aquabacterium commune TaxID=70586 RepID=A0A4R6R769_9BURK|nr:hypothetical protein [Aquabacterium commune]TDP81712.1 hypothetical protein EV672_107143 [Aquabacterium commune]
MTRPPSFAQTLRAQRAVSVALATVAAVGALAAVSTPSPTLAQLADPTRAPYVLPRNAAPSPGAAGLNPATAALLRQAGVPAGALAGESAGEAATRAAPPPPPKPRHRLTSVMLGNGAGRSVAIIDGEVYRVGDKVQGATLTAIDATGVLLGSGKGAARLSLFARQPEGAASAPSANHAKDKGPASPGGSAQPEAAPTAMPQGQANAFPSLQNGARPDKDTP